MPQRPQFETASNSALNSAVVTSTRRPLFQEFMPCPPSLDRLAVEVRFWYFARTRRFVKTSDPRYARADSRQPYRPARHSRTAAGRSDRRVSGRAGLSWSVVNAYPATV